MLTPVSDSRRAVGPAWLALWAAACTAGPDTEEAGRPVATWTVGPTPDVVIGEPDRGDAHDLYRVVDATRLSDGRLVVGNGGTSELRYYGPDGTHLRNAAGEGVGPAEFAQMVDIQRLAGDTVAAFGWRKLAWFAPDGDFVRSLPYDASRLQLPCRIGEDGYLLPDATLIRTMPEGPFHGEDCPTSSEGRFRPATLVVREDPATGRFDTLGTVPGTERVGTRANFAVYGRDLDIAFSTDRVVIGDTGADTVHALSLSGDTLSAYGIPWPRTAVPGSARREPDPTRERDDGGLEVTREYVYPEEYPRFGRIVLDGEGYLWVMDYPDHDDPGVRSYAFRQRFQAAVEEGGARWRILAPDGTWVAEARTPPGLFPLEIGRDYLLGVWRDELDVQRVELHALNRGTRSESARPEESTR